MKLNYLFLSVNLIFTISRSAVPQFSYAIDKLNGLINELPDKPGATQTKTALGLARNIAQNPKGSIQALLEQLNRAREYAVNGDYKNTIFQTRSGAVTLAEFGKKIATLINDLQRATGAQPSPKPQPQPAPPPQESAAQRQQKAAEAARQKAEEAKKAQDARQKVEAERQRQQAEHARKAQEARQAEIERQKKEAEQARQKIETERQRAEAEYRKKQAQEAHAKAAQQEVPPQPKPAPAPKPTPTPQPAPAGQPGTANQPIGLPNVGNSCFMNGVLQSVFSLERLTDAVLKKAGTNFYQPGSLADSYIKLAKGLRGAGAVDPTPFCIQSWQLMGFDPLTQQDALEFIQILLDSLIYSEEKEETYTTENLELPRSGRPTASSKRKTNPDVKINHDIIELIGVTLQPYIDGQPSPTEQTFLLNLIPKPSTLEDCIKDFFSPEEIEFIIEKSKTREIRKKVFKITKIHDYFILGLKRNFYPTKEAALQGKLQKREDAVTFPLENLNINKYMEGAQAKPYRLKAFVVHAGSAHGGHYWAYVRKGNTWFECNDTAVSQRPLSAIQEIATKGYVGKDLRPAVPFLTVPVLFFYEAQ